MQTDGIASIYAYAYNAKEWKIYSYKTLILSFEFKYSQALLQMHNCRMINGSMYYIFM